MTTASPRERLLRRIELDLIEELRSAERARRFADENDAATALDCVKRIAARERERFAQARAEMLATV